MKCVICKHGETGPGKATVTLERDGLTVVTKSVPAQVRTNCGEEYVDEDVAARLLALVDEADRAGAQVDIREFVAA